MAARPQPEPCHCAAHTPRRLAVSVPGIRLRGAGTVAGSRAAFSLVELLVVLAIIGILASLALPAFKGLGRSNLVVAANRQIMDDVALARTKAISERTTVFMLFVPPLVTSTNLSARQLTAYALMTRRSVGAQPGQLNPRFLTEWRDLPEGVFIPPYKFDLLNGYARRTINEYTNSFHALNSKFFIGLDTNIVSQLRYRYLAFSPRGQLVVFNESTLQLDPQEQDEIIPVGRGSVFLERDNKGVVKTNSTPDVIESQAATRTYIRVNRLTGRARVEKREVQ